MKKIFFIFAIALGILSVSCNKDLNQIPISQGTTLTFYQSPSDFIQGVNAAYSSLRGYPDRLLNLSEIRSDNIYGVSDLGVRDWDPINSFQKAITGNLYVEEAWSTDFNGIFRAKPDWMLNHIFYGLSFTLTLLNILVKFLSSTILFLLQKQTLFPVAQLPMYIN
jgi:hypothetical protein